MEIEGGKQTFTLFRLFAMFTLVVVGYDFKMSAFIKYDSRFLNWQKNSRMTSGLKNRQELKCFNSTLVLYDVINL